MWPTLCQTEAIVPYKLNIINISISVFCCSCWETGWRIAVGLTPWYRPILPALELQSPSFKPAMLPRPATHTKSQLRPSTHYSIRHTVKTAHRRMATPHSQMIRRIRPLRSGAHGEQRPVCTLTTGSRPCHWSYSYCCTFDHFVKGTSSSMWNP